MTKKLTEKYNDSCVKLFEFLKMLYQGDVEFKRVINHFSDGEYNGKSNTHVTLNKYLNAMRIFGIKVKKIKRKYKMYSSLYKLKFNLDDLKSIKYLKQIGDILPEGKTKTDFESFIRELEIRFDESAQNIFQLENNTQNLNFEFSNSEITDQLQYCIKLCQDKQKLEIVFTDEKGEDINLLCSPLEQIYQKRKFCLKVLGNNGSRVYEIPIDSIKSIKQLPIASSNQAIPTTVVYRIKNKLAKNYKLRDWERVDKLESDGSQIIVNKNEDLNLLVDRLMRYGTQCTIISPKFLKEEMIERINNTLKNYEQ